jgi:hypothetical protein
MRLFFFQNGGAMLVDQATKIYVCGEKFNWENKVIAGIIQNPQRPDQLKRVRYVHSSTRIFVEQLCSWRNLDLIILFLPVHEVSNAFTSVFK